MRGFVCPFEVAWCQIPLRTFLSDSSTLLAIRLMVEYRANGRLISHLVPDPWIDSGVKEIDDPIGEDNAEDHDDGDSFIQQEFWRASEEPVPPGFQDLPPSPPQRMWRCMAKPQAFYGCFSTTRWIICTSWLPSPRPSERRHCNGELRGQACILESRMLVHRAFEVGGTVLPVPNPWIDDGVQQIGDQVGEDTAVDHTDCGASSTQSLGAHPRSQCLGRREWRKSIQSKQVNSETEP